MSARALRALRGDDFLLSTVAADHDDDEDDDEDEDDDDDDEQQKRKPQRGPPSRQPSAFAAMMMEDDSSEEEEDDDDDDNHDKNDNNNNNNTDGEETPSKAIIPPPDESRPANTIPERQPEKPQRAPLLVDPAKAKTTTTTTTTSRQEVDKIPLKEKEEEKADKEEEDIDDDDIDAILHEFQDQLVTGKDATKRTTEPDSLHSGTAEADADAFPRLLQGWDPRDLDIEYTMRHSLLGASSTTSSSNTTNPSLSSSKLWSRKKRPGFFFGPPRDGWIRPPHYVGGGLGMTTYDQAPRRLPWPYSEMAATQEPAARAEPATNTNWTTKMTTTAVSSSLSFFSKDAAKWSDPKRWFTFVHSDSYQKDCADFALIQQSGDLNALVLFVAHHPYVTEAVLQLSMVLYQTNHTHDGLALLRRGLWIYESAAMISFTRGCCLDYGAAGMSSSLMDADQPENAIFFKALTRLIQVSNIAGYVPFVSFLCCSRITMDHSLTRSISLSLYFLIRLPRTALAVSRYTLSLDPLRDPMGLLLAMDHFALATNLTAIDQWLVQLVDSNQIQICYIDTEKQRRIYRCELLGLPNWMYSYALALHRLCQENPTEEAEKRANEALRNAINRFPAVVGQLLQENEVDTTGRSFRRDWVTVLDFSTERARKLYNEWSASSVPGVDAVDMAATLQVTELIVKIFVMQNAKQWSDDGVLQWLYDNLKELKKTAPLDAPEPPSLALMRYAEVDPANYDNKIPQFPPEANIIDPNLLAHAMMIDPNRGRFLRRENRPDLGEPRNGGDFVQGMGNPQFMFAGPPTNVINPDWPLVEVFWRSFFPWNRVEGIPPPRR